MHPEVWRKLESVFFGALDLEADARRQYLDRVCAGDVSFRAEVEAVIAAHEREEERGGLDGLEPRALLGRRGSLVGTTLGAYRLVALVGRGGMGDVYHGRRADEQFHQEVAVKVLRPGYAAEELVRRFRVEREVLAQLQHPHIAPLLDGGVTADGRPYLVMQYVHGVPITEYADGRRLSVSQRLVLVRTVCEAVQFAHANLIVHRDLKPSNILVTESGQVRLLDFGIAKLLDPARLGVAAPATEEMILLTPEHAAPEQIEGGQITTAADVYALGVLLYQLLVGVRPFQAASRAELRRAVCETQPVRPSAALFEGAAGAAPADPPRREEIAGLRGTRPEALARQVRGDLDQIVLMALRKEPERRYASAGQLGEDIGRFLAGRPVIAQPDTLRYRARTFVRRNPTSVGFALLAAATLAAGLIGTTWQARRARAEALQAAADRDRAERVSALLTDMFRLSDPTSVRGQSITAREILDRGVAGIARDFADQPEVQADLLTEVGRIYANLGLFAEAGQHLADALALRRAADGEGDPRTAESMTELARVRTALGDAEEALTLADRAVSVLRRASAPDRATRLPRALIGLGAALRLAGDPAKANQAYAEAVSLLQAAGESDDARMAEAFFGWADAAHRQGQFDRADSLLEETIARYQRLGAGPYPDEATALYQLGMIRVFRGRSAESVPLLERALAMQREIYGAVHPVVAETITGLMGALSLAGRFDEAAAIGDEAVAVSDAAWGRDHASAAEVRHGLAFILIQRDEGERAVPLLERANLILRGRPQANRTRLVANGVLFGQAYAAMGQFARARQQYVTTLRLSDGLLGSEHAYRAHLLLELARLDLDAGRLEPAEAEAEASLALTRRILRPDHRFAQWALVLLARLRAARGDLAAADSMLRGVLTMQTGPEGAGSHTSSQSEHVTALTLVTLADVETRLGQAVEAEGHATAALSALQASYVTGPRVAEARSVLGGALAAQGRLTEAEPLLRSAYRDLTQARGARPPQVHAAAERLGSLTAGPRADRH
jgi:serine/threonine-protein kinase